MPEIVPTAPPLQSKSPRDDSEDTIQVDSFAMNVRGGRASRAGASYADDMHTINAIRVRKAANPGEPTPPVTTAHRVDHRDGAGHLDAAYEASLCERASHCARNANDRAFVSGTWSSDPAAVEAAEEFIIAVTSGENGSMLDAVMPEENGGPFVETSAATEFAYDTDFASD